MATPFLSVRSAGMKKAVSEKFVRTCGVSVSSRLAFLRMARAGIALLSTAISTSRIICAVVHLLDSILSGVTPPTRILSLLR